MPKPIEKMDALAYESSDLKEGAKQYGMTVQSSPLFAKKVVQKVWPPIVKLCKRRLVMKY
jgi:hypothetical protein